MNNKVTRYNLKHGPDHVSEVEKDINGVFIEYSAYEELKKDHKVMLDWITVLSKNHKITADSYEYIFSYIQRTAKLLLEGLKVKDDE